VLEVQTHHDLLTIQPHRDPGTIGSRQDLTRARQTFTQLLDLRLDRGETGTTRRMVLVCGGSGCIASDSEKIVAAMRSLIEDNGLTDQFSASIAGCFGFCEKGPIVKILPDDVFYVNVTPEDVEDIFVEHLLGDRLVDRLLYEVPGQAEKIARQDDIPFYRSQQRVTLRHSGVINPEDIREYIGMGGYEGIAKALSEMTPQEVIAEVKDSGLRGRGGAGFPTGTKWEFARRSQALEKFVICNADEGDPGAFMDRSIMEGDAHSVIEGMMIAGYAIGAHQGYVYIRAEYPLATRRLENAIAQARSAGLLGHDVLGSGFDFDVEIRLGAGAFVCGEETALIQSLQGSRGEPRTKPPFPAVSGLWGSPTLVNNVETLATLPVVITRGAAWYSGIGTPTSKGTKIFALAGQVNNVGLVEVPMGTTLREIIYEIGGGIKDGGEFKAVQTGGPSGGCIPAQYLDMPIDYESLKSIGSMMGSGGMIVLSDKSCMPNIARFYLEFTVDESCGRCTPCRIGNKRMLEILTDITEGRGSRADLDELSDLAQVIIDTSLCGLGQSSPNPVLSTLRYFRDEYEAHVTDRRCPAKVCQDLAEYRIITEKCTGCTACSRLCPVGAVQGSIKKPHTIDQSLCIKCGVCLSRCKFKAVVKV
jgi:NADH:ubiquinone oxidoreductase subunit F (NADH-binding)/(2Fe-2S) ferredoxin/NAD-dependent dihydropyrimidine dehydrogenase PreA subunit